VPLLFPEQFDGAMVEVKVACVVRMRYQLGPTAVPNCSCIKNTSIAVPTAQCSLNCASFVIN